MLRRMVDSARSASSGDRFIVPAGVPHMAPVLEMGDGRVWRRYAPDYLCARESDDQQTWHEIDRWVRNQHDEAHEFVAVLLSHAVTAVSTAYGVHAQEMLSHIGRLRRDWPPNAHQFASEMVEGYHASVELVDLELSADTVALEHLIARVMVNPDMRQGAAAGLADITILVLRWKWGNAAEMLAALRHALTGIGDSHAMIGGPADPGAELTAELEAALGLPSTSGSRAADSSRSWTTGDLFTGLRLMTSFLCYRDAGATCSLDRIREWLQANPNSGMGFLQGLAGFAQMSLVHARGDASAIELARGLITTGASYPIPADIAGVPCGEEFAEGYRSAPAILYHLLVGDHPAYEALISRAQETVSLVWGSASGLAEIGLAVVRITQGDTQVVQGLHDLMATPTTGQSDGTAEDDCADSESTTADETIRRLGRLLQGPDGLLASSEVDYEVLPDGSVRLHWTGEHSAIDVWRVLTEQLGDEVEIGDCWHPFRTDVYLGEVRVTLVPRNFQTLFKSS